MIDPLRWYLLAGMAAHKLVWEALRPADGSEARSPRLDLLRWVKAALLGALVVQTLVPGAVLPIAAEPRLLRWAGAALYTLGVAVAVTARFQIGPNWSDIENPVVRPGRRLVSHGLYRFIRHPIYAGDLALVGGLELSLNSWLAAGVAAVAAFTVRRALEEERLLTEGLPGYGDYCRRTRRFIPLIL